MAKNLNAIDTSQNMEDLRSARSFNDIVYVLSRIKSSVDSINQNFSKHYKVKAEETSSNTDTDQQNASFDSLNRKHLTAVHNYMEQLHGFKHEMRFARSVSDVITSDAKMEKFRKLCEQVDDNLNRTINLGLSYLNLLGSSVEPEKLSKFSEKAREHLSKVVPSERIVSFVFPDSEQKIGFTRFIVLQNVTTSSGFAIAELIVAIHARNNFDDTFTYSVSFPISMFELDEQFTFFNQKQLFLALNSYLDEHQEIQPLTKTQNRRYIETMPNIYSTYVKDNQLFVELESGVTGSNINAILTRLLPVVHTALNVKNPRTDIVHRVATLDKGNKAIVIRLSNRNFYNQKAFSDLRKMLSLESRTFKALMSSVKE